MQFKDSGKLIEAGQNGSFFKSLFGKSPYKKISSMSDLEGNDLAKFKSIMKIGEDGLSEYSMADIKAKSSMLGFGDSLTNEITALAKDADFTAKAATGKLTFAKALEDGTISTEELGSALQKHLKETGSKSFNPLVKAAEQGTKEYQDKVRDIIESSDDVANAVIKSGEKVSQKTGIFSSAASLGKGMLTGAKKLVKSVGPYALAAAAAYGGYKLWDHSQTKYTRANEALNKSSGEYETTKTELTSLNSQLDETKSKIEELESLKRTSGGKLSLTDEAELSTLQKQNDELERQITLKQNMADNQAEIVAKDAKSVAKTGQTYTEAMREEHGKVLGTLMGITGHLANPNSGKTASETWAKENGGKNGKATLEQQMKANLKTLKKYKKQLKEAQEDEDQDATDKAQENVDKMTAKVSKQASKLQDIIDKSKDANGNVLKSMASTVDDYNSLITEFNNIDLTKKQKDVNNLDNFFNSSSGSAMKDYLSDIVQNGGSATDALKAFREAGGRLKDIDVSKGSFLEYFDEIKKQAEEAKEAIKTVDGTVQGVTEAFNSANQDANWSTMADYLKQADDLFAKGKVGTDDFKTAAQFMSPTVINPDEKDNNGKDKFKYDSEAYTKAWTNAQAKVKRYFDSENPFDSAQHFVDDLTSKGFASKSGDEFEWTKKFKSSAAAAKELGLSVEATEVLMRNLESYGAEFDDVVFSSENLKSYKSSLDGIKTILDEMGDGEKRDRLQKLYEGWDSEYEKYQNDMDSLSNDVVVKIKFEYDLASIQQKVDEIQSSWDNGDKSAKTGATLLAAKERELKLLEDQLKYTAGQDKGYDNSKKSVSDISTKLSKTTDKDKIKTLQEQKGAFLDLQNAFNIFKNDGGQLNWSEFLKSDQATSTLNDIISKTDITKEKLADLLGVDSKDLQITVDANTAEAENKLKGIAANDGKTIVMDVNANTDQIQNAIDALQDGQTLMFNATAKIDGKDVQKQVTAENVNGEIHYKTVIDNKEVELVKNQDGTFKIKTVVDDTAVEDEKNKVEKNPLTQEVDADTTKASGKLDGLVAQDGKTIVLDVNASTDEVQDKLNMLEQGQTVVFTANVDNATQAVEAIRNEKGELEYYVTLEDGSKTKLTELEHQNGEFVFSTDTSKVKDAENEINGIMSNDGKTIYMNVDASTSDINNAISSIEDEDHTVIFHANVGDIPATLAAYQNEEGQVIYTANINGVEYYVEQVKHEDGTISYELGDYPKEVPSAKQRIDRYPNDTGVMSDPAGVKQNVLRTPDNSGVMSNPAPVYQSVIRTVTEQLNQVSSGNALAATVGLTANSPKKGKKRRFNGTANASGNWSVQKSENSLVGELGREIIVRNGKFFTVGDNGAEFAHIQKGDIIFNHRQSEELLKNGYVTSGGGRARVFGEANVNGTAYANGLKLKKNNSVLSSTKKSTRSKSSRTSKAKSSSGSNTKSNSNSKSSDSAEKSEELLDWIETLLSRTSRLTELATSAVDRAVGLANKQNALVNAVTKTQNEITTNQNAANKYFAEADSLKLAPGYVDKIKNGTLNIESITDDNLKDKISKYKDYYERGLSAQDKVLDLQDKLNELYQKRLEIIEKEYDTIVEVNDSLKDMLDAKISYNSAYGVANDNQDNIDSINKSIKAQEDTFNQLTKKFDEYQKEVNSQIASGTLKKGSEDYRSAQKNLNDFTANIYKASQELIELRDKLVQLRADAIQTIIDTFQRRSDKLDKYSSLLEAKDEIVPESVYQERLDNNNDTIRKNQEARAIWLKRQATEDVNSDNYKKYAEEIQKLDESTLDLLKDNEDLKNSIYSLRIKNLEDAIQGYDDLETELKGFRDLLNDDAFLDKKGGITDEGLAQITLLSQSIGNAKQKISDLTTGLQKVKELYDNGVISLKEYNEKSAEYRKELQSSTSDVKSYQKSLTDLYQNALKAEVDALQKVISKRKEATQAKEEYYSYDKKIREQTNDVNALKSQVAALEGVNDAATLAKKKKLEQQLKDAQETLDDTKRDHRNDLISKGYDKISDDLNQMLEDTEYEISHNADKQNEIIQSMLNKQVGMYQEAYSKINSIIKNTGWVGSNDFNNNQSQMSSQTGAQNQASNASQSQQTANSKPSSSASGTNTSGIKDNASKNDKITENIMKPENTTNRPVAELTVSKSSVSIEEGKSTSVTTKIRPNDAANKKLSWKSSNTAIATVSNGTISGKKPGSCQVTVSTTDGSGISKTIAVTVTKKPDPPKPVIPSNKGGDGVPRVGDVVTFNGKYYYDSWGKRPAGSLYSGVTNGVVIDSYSSREYGGSARYTGDLKVHIKSRDGRYGDLGWVRLSQISGYAKGTPGVDRDQIAIVDEEGRELQIPNGKGGRITKLEKGTGVIPHTATEKLMALSEQLDNNGNMIINGRTIEEYVNDMANMQSIAVPDFSDVTASVVSQLEGKGMGNVTVENHYDSLLTVEGNVDKDALPGLEDILKRSYEYTSKKMVKELRKGGMQIRR